MKIKKIIDIILIVLGSLVILAMLGFALFPFLNALIIGTKDYKPFVGLLRSDFAGFDNFIRFLKYKYAGRMILNSFTIGSLSLIIGSAYVFISVLSSASIKNTFLKTFVVLLFALPFAVPADIYVKCLKEILPIGYLTTPSFMLILICSAGSSIRLASLFSLAGLFIKKKAFIKTLIFVGMFAATKCLFFFNVDFIFQYLIQSPSNYEVTEVLDTYIYVQGLQSNSFSYGTAAGLVITFLNLIPAIIACAGISLWFSIGKSEKEDLGGKAGGFAPVAILGILPVFIVAVALFIAHGNKNITDTIGVMPYINSILISVMCVFVALINIFFAAYAGKKLKFGGAIALCAICLISNNLIPQFLILKWIGLLGTYIAPVVFNMRYLPILALVFAMFLRSRGTLGTKLAVLPLSAGIAFAFSWGDLFAANITLNNEAMYPLSIFSRKINLESIMEFKSVNIDPSFLAYTLIPVIILAICIIAGGLLTLIGNKPKKTEKQ